MAWLLQREDAKEEADGDTKYKKKIQRYKKVSSYMKNTEVIVPNICDLFVSALNSALLGTGD